MCSVLSRKYDKFYSFDAACSPARRDCKSTRIDFGKKPYGERFAVDEGFAQQVRTGMPAKKPYATHKRKDDQLQ